MKNELWILSEWIVARDRVSRFRNSLLSHRERTPFAEVDLVFSSGDSCQAITIIEVKTWRGDIWGPHLISRSQIGRLERARAFMESRTRKPVCLMLAVLDPVAAVLASKGGSSLEGLVHYFDFPL
jgi:Holliday junction resolvase-like predicted endonuclease